MYKCKVRGEPVRGVTVTDSIDPAEAGTQVTYTVMVTNNTSVDATGVVATSSLSSGLMLVSTNGCAEDPSGHPM